MITSSLLLLSKNLFVKVYGSRHEVVPMLPLPSSVPHNHFILMIENIHMGKGSYPKHFRHAEPALTQWYYTEHVASWVSTCPRNSLWFWAKFCGFPARWSLFARRQPRRCCLQTGLKTVKTEGSKCLKKLM